MIGSLNCAKDVPPISLTLVDVTSSGIENLNVVFSAFPTHTKPDRNVRNFGVLSVVVPKFISLIRIVAVAAVFERGTYPISVSYTHLTLPTKA